jgi:hypothetical protein
MPRLSTSGWVQTRSRRYTRTSQSGDAGAAGAIESAYWQPNGCVCETPSADVPCAAKLEVFCHER